MRKTQVALICLLFLLGAGAALWVMDSEKSGVRVEVSEGPPLNVSVQVKEKSAEPDFKPTSMSRDALVEPDAEEFLDSDIRSFESEENDETPEQIEYVVRGKVLDWNDKPLAGAKIEVALARTWKRGKKYSGRTPPALLIKASGKASTKQSGKFELRFVLDLRESVDEVIVDLLATRDGYRSDTQVALFPGNPGKPETVSFRLYPAHTSISGLVEMVGDDFSPRVASGVKVKLGYFGPSNDFDARIPRSLREVFAETQTGINGEYTFNDLPAGIYAVSVAPIWREANGNLEDRASWEFYHSAFSSTSFQVIIARDHEEVVQAPTLFQHEMQSIRFRLLPSPPVDFDVTLRRGESSYRHKLKANHDGQYSVVSIPSLTDSIDILVPGYAPLRRKIEAKPGESADLGEIELPLATDYLEAVVMGYDGDVVSSVQVSIAPRWPDAGAELSFAQQAESDQDGRVSFAQLARGTHLVVLKHPEYGVTRHRVEMPSSESLVYLELMPSLTLSGEISVDSKLLRALGYEKEADAMNDTVIALLPKDEEFLNGWWLGSNEQRRQQVHDVELRTRPYGVGSSRRWCYKIEGVAPGNYDLVAILHGHMTRYEIAVSDNRVLVNSRYSLEDAMSRARKQGEKPYEMSLRLKENPKVILKVDLGKEYGSGNVVVALQTTPRYLENLTKLDFVASLSKRGSVTFEGVPYGRWFVLAYGPDGKRAKDDDEEYPLYQEIFVTYKSDGGSEYIRLR